MIKPALGDDEFMQYFALRYRLLRQPWGEPEGSEKDDIEDQCFHVIAKDGESVIGVGRLQFNSAEEAQIRYMAVDTACERRGIGRQIVAALEKHASAQGRHSMVLDAREPAVGFYRRLGYTVTGPSYLLFGEIQHYAMRKQLR